MKTVLFLSLAITLSSACSFGFITPQDQVRGDLMLVQETPVRVGGAVATEAFIMAANSDRALVIPATLGGASGTSDEWTNALLNPGKN